MVLARLNNSVELWLHCNESKRICISSFLCCGVYKQRAASACNSTCTHQVSHGNACAYAKALYLLVT
jgi:beta-glucosidase/6-phospho-beta-glucosidase/beta-galactosidase